MLTSRAGAPRGSEQTHAEMSERPKEHDWKSCVPRKGTEGSNPSLCAMWE